jgi:type IV pilus assembly protein PilM
MTGKPGSQPKAKNKLALDIGSDSIKLLEVGFSDKSVLNAIGFKKLPDRTGSGITESIKSLIEETNSKVEDANIGLSGASVIVRLISMPKMKDAELKNAIKFEAEKFISFNIEDCILDSQILSKNDSEGKLNVLLAAAKKSYVTERIKAVEAAGLSVALIDVDVFALANSFLKNFPSADPAKSFALINIGASAINLNIMRASTIGFARDMAMGANDFISVISKRLGVELRSAEDLKAVPADKAQDMLNHARQALAGFIDEARMSFSYYENQSGAGIDEIYVSGGAASIPGVAESLEENFGSKPVIWNPLQFLDMSSGKADPKIIENMKSSFAVASGLALR